jgi:CO/xanthine dehydrogenase FAD-binding subunit
MFENVETFCRPASMREAVQLLHNAKGSARIIAGCTDLIVEGDASVRCLIDLHHAGLSYIRRRGANWTIGATTTMAEIEESRVLCVLAGGLLSRAAATCGGPQIRNMATVGGNMANGSPAADLATSLLALDAWTVMADLTHKHRIPLADYLPVARTREMRSSLLVEVGFPEPPHGSRCAWSFQKFGRTEVDISLVNVAAGLQLDAHGRVKWARLALGAVAATPIRIAAAEELMTGRILDQALLTEVCELVMREVSPISDIRAAADYRRELSRVLTGRAIEDCAAHAGCSL